MGDAERKGEVDGFFPRHRLLVQVVDEFDLLLPVEEHNFGVQLAVRYRSLQRKHLSIGRTAQPGEVHRGGRSHGQPGQRQRLLQVDKLRGFVAPGDIQILIHVVGAAGGGQFFP